ncbi:MAG: folate family ECF transporter S component [Bacilli bacterium]
MSKTRVITLSALFSAISIVLTRYFAIPVPLGGFPSLSIELGGIPIVMGGIILGPFAGGIIGAISDIIGFLINDRGGVYHFGFTLNAILTGAIPGVLFMIFKKYHANEKVFKIINYILVSLLTVLGNIYIFTVQSDVILVENRWIACGALIIVYIALMLIITFVSKNKTQKSFITFNQVILVVVLVEVFVYILLTPIWIYGLFGIPNTISIASRVFRAVFMIPIKSIVIYYSLVSLKNLR